MNRVKKDYILAFASKSAIAFFDASDCLYPDVDMSTELTSVNTEHTTSASIALPLVSPFCPHRNTKMKHAMSDAQFSMLVAVESLDVVSNLANGSAMFGMDSLTVGAGAGVGADGMGMGTESFFGSGGKRVGSTTYVAIYISSSLFFR